MASPGEIEKLERRWIENMQGLTFAPLAEAYRKAGRLDEAFQTLELGLAHHPDYVPAYIVRGRCALDAHDDAAAATAFALVLSFDSLNLIALRGLAEISLRSGRPQEAILHLRRLLDVDRTDVEAANRLAELQAAATPAPAAEYAPRPAPAGESSPGGEATDDSAYPLMDFTEDQSRRETPESLGLSLGVEASDPDPIDLRIDARWSYPGAASEFAIANDSETLSTPPVAPADEFLGHGDMDDGTEPALPPIDVVPTLRDMEEWEPLPETTDSVEEDPPLSGTDHLVSVAMGASPDGGPVFDEMEETGTSSETDESGESVAEPDRPEEVLLRVLETELDASANPWSPADLTQQVPAGDEVPVKDDDTPIRLKHDAPDSIPSAEEPDEVVDGLLEVTPAESPVPGPGSPGWMSDEAGCDGTPALIPMGMSDELPDDGGDENSMASDLEEEVSLSTEGEDDEDALVVTESMAEIFLRQGHDELALAVYTELARRDPDDARLQEAIARLATLPPVEDAPMDAPVAPVRGRFAASNTGGESLGDFLAVVLAVREPTSPTAITPPAMDRPREGEPTRPSDRHFGLDAVFGDDSADVSVPSAAAAETPREGESPSPSFDEFFEDRPPAIAPPSSDSHATGGEDLQHFNEWLKGLKR